MTKTQVTGFDSELLTNYCKILRELEEESVQDRRPLYEKMKGYAKDRVLEMPQKWRSLTQSVIKTVYAVAKTSLIALNCGISWMGLLRF